MKKFRGTKGDLRPIYISGICTGIGKEENGVLEITANSILPDSEKEYEEQKEVIKADMQLYSAAPELLEALQHVMESKNNIKHYIDFDKSLMDALDKSEKAINKALGQ